MRHFAIAAVSAALTMATAADASHNRGSAVIPSIDSSGVLTLEATTFWRPSFVDQIGNVTITEPGGGSMNLFMGTRTTDTSDSRFTRSDQTASTSLDPNKPGLYTITWSSCCRVSGISNASASTFGTTSTIFWDGKNATSPITFDIQNIQPNVVRGAAYSDNLGVTSANGDTISYDDTVLGPSISSQAPGFSIDASGQITIPSGSTTAVLYPDNGSNDGADVAFSAEIIAKNSTGQTTGTVQFDWLFDAVDKGSNQVPSVSSVVVNATIGDMINEMVTGTDPNGDIVSLSFGTFTGPGGSIAGSSFTSTDGDPAKGTFKWDSTGFGPGTYIATIFGTDGGLTDSGTVTINLTAGGPTVPPIPVPAGFVLMGSALAGLGLMRRRQRR